MQHLKALKALNTLLANVPLSELSSHTIVESQPVGSDPDECLLIFPEFDNITVTVGSLNKGRLTQKDLL